ncbi:MAG: VWA domain-containing protein [Treponema sp.]|uniref:vWA domain-containing protein n=1 Tax=Treponema sp. TaxID=166 RepID=UPI0025E5FD24|nr:vWA domain-containing protein [Treponema sp.]MBQ8679963.1 VWA domain-containing protein [Treponema sp.]
MGNKTNSTCTEKLNLPALKKIGGGLSKKAESKPFKKFDINAVKQQNSVDKIIKTDSIKQQMHKEQQAYKGLDLVLMGDLTGSMSSYHSILKSKFREICTTLFQLIPNLRIGIIFYLDHGSGDIYITKVQQLTVDVQKLQDFITDTPDGNGGDADEAVEDALHDALVMNWNEINTHSIVLFGDARPHESYECPYQYDYFEIVKNLYQKQVTVNTVYCSSHIDYRRLASLYEVEIGDFSHRVSRLDHPDFFSWIANVTGGVAIGVEQIDDIVDIIKAMAAKDAGKIDELEEEELKLAHRPIPALKHIKERAKQIEEKKKILGIGYKPEK